MKSVKRDLILGCFYCNSIVPTPASDDLCFKQLPPIYGQPLQLLMSLARMRRLASSLSGSYSDGCQRCPFSPATVANSSVAHHTDHADHNRRLTTNLRWTNASLRRPSITPAFISRHSSSAFFLADGAQRPSPADNNMRPLGSSAGVLFSGIPVSLITPSKPVALRGPRRPSVPSESTGCSEHQTSRCS